jgi:hypothetical protein
MEVARLSLTLGNARRAFLYRKGTVDEAVIVQALQNGACDLGRLSRGNELAAYAERLTADGKAPLIVDVSANIGATAVFLNYKFPQARIVAFEADPANFELLTANTADLPVECVQAPAAAASGDDPACATLDALYDSVAPEAAPFIVKLDVESDVGLVTADCGWIARTPVIVASLGDYLIPGTANSRALVAAVAPLDRDFVYEQDNVFSIDRAAATGE